MAELAIQDAFTPYYEGRQPEVETSPEPGSGWVSREDPRPAESGRSKPAERTARN